MRAETIEWITPNEKMPDNLKPLIGIMPNGTAGELFYHHETKSWIWVIGCHDSDDAPPQFWAYMPKGPK